MTLDYSVPGQVQISMFDYIEEILTAFDKAEPKCTSTKIECGARQSFQGE